MRDILESGINDDLLFPKCKNLSLGEALMAEINIERYENWIKKDMVTWDWNVEPTITLTRLEILRAYKKTERV